MYHPCFEILLRKFFIGTGRDFGDQQRFQESFVVSQKGKLQTKNTKIDLFYLKTGFGKNSHFKLEG